jgi:methionine-gamma-lyase
MERKHSKTGLPFQPETLALGYGYDPFLSEGSVKPPAFLTSTFQFRSAEAGERHFALAYRLAQQRPSEAPGLIYSRLNNPNIEIFEQRLAAWDGTEKAAVFASGMAAISTLCLNLLRPGDVVLASAPIYGGTHYLLHHVLSEFGVQARLVAAGLETPALLAQAAQELGPERVRLILLETPANPSNTLVDIEAVARLTRSLPGTKRGPALLAVDNTFLGPVFQKPAQFGADLVIYSATKFIAGHSDLIAGVVSGRAALVDELALLRAILGTVASPFTGWLLLRSLETLSVRMRQQSENAEHLARVLAAHPAVERVCYPGLLAAGSAEHALFRRQCSGPGSLIAFELRGGKTAAMRALNRFEVARLAVSLGGTESLVEHPASMTHADVPLAELQRYGVGPGMIRMSVGLEDVTDLEHDLLAALEPEIAAV